MPQLEKLYFLIHGFCYACLYPDGAASPSNERLWRYIERENACARQWSARLGELNETDGLVIIPFDRGESTRAYYNAARTMLGERVFLLDCPDCHSPAFWSGSAGEYAPALLNEIGAAFIHQGMVWNKEEMYTTLHCLACYQQLNAMLAQRGLTFDPVAVTAEAWGASFDGCVTKYSLILRRLLGLTKVIEIEFDLTVPDAFFLLDASLKECIQLNDSLRLFIFSTGQQTAGLYTATQHSLADTPGVVSLPVAPELVTVKSKQGIRLWPQPEEYRLENVEPGYTEPPQAVVQYAQDGLHIPVSAGFVYRLAKAPAYVFMPAMMTYEEAQAILAAVRMP